MLRAAHPPPPSEDRTQNLETMKDSKVGLAAVKEALRASARCALVAGI